MKRPTNPSLRTRTSALAAALALIAAFAAFVGAPAVAGATDITSAGPLTTITTTPDLNCSVSHVGDTDPEFYGTTACGTFVTDGTSIWGPATVPAGGNVTGAANYHAWTPVSQNGPTGAGTAANPYTVVTIVKGGSFTVTQTDTYVVGQETVRTDVQVSSSSAVNATVYRAGDCYLQDSDSGLGRLDGGIAPTCVADPTSAQPNRIEQWFPITGGSHYIVDVYSTVWAAIASMAPFPNTVKASDNGDIYDNGGGLSWSQPIAAGASTTISSIMTFSPIGVSPLVVTKTASPSTVAPGGQVTYTITIANTNVTPQTITQISDMLPAGFGYVTGSTHGATTQDPSLACLPLIWNGPFTVPAGSSQTAGLLTLTFVAQAPSTPGTYTNSATASSNGATVIAAMNTAPVTVTGPTT
ncbi:MAG: DUF11 domain-containing protein, partial [Actinobacteria bacterium]|nr:DUF11 domain-containing protein [Actinomycetota bacterium]